MELPACTRSRREHDWYYDEVSTRCQRCRLAMPKGWIPPEWCRDLDAWAVLRRDPAASKAPRRGGPQPAVWLPSPRLRMLLERDGDACHYCGRTCTFDRSDTRATIDHKVPRVRGGTNEAINLVVACSRCNNAKGQKPYDEFLAVIDRSGWRCNRPAA